MLRRWDESIGPSRRSLGAATRPLPHQARSSIRLPRIRADGCAGRALPIPPTTARMQDCADGQRGSLCLETGGHATRHVQCRISRRLPPWSRRSLLRVKETRVSNNDDDAVLWHRITADVPPATRIKPSDSIGCAPKPVLALRIGASCDHFPVLASYSMQDARTLPSPSSPPQR